jgi:hypothetical protein
MKAVVSVLPPVNDVITVERVAEDCHLSFQRSVSGILNCGEKLKALKGKIGDGWLAAFGEDRAGNIISSNPFPFRRRTADMMIDIYKRFAGTNGSIALPPSWRTLYELAKLTDEQLSKADIRADMTRAEVKALRSPPEPKPPKPLTGKSVGRFIESFANKLAEKLDSGIVVSVEEVRALEPQIKTLERLLIALRAECYVSENVND